MLEDGTGHRNGMGGSLWRLMTSLPNGLRLHQPQVSYFASLSMCVEMICYHDWSCREAHRSCGQAEATHHSMGSTSRGPFELHSQAVDFHLRERDVPVLATCDSCCASS